MRQLLSISLDSTFKSASSAPCSMNEGDYEKRQQNRWNWMYSQWKKWKLYILRRQNIYIYKQRFWKVCHILLEMHIMLLLKTIKSHTVGYAKYKNIYCKLVQRIGRHLSAQLKNLPKVWRQHKNRFDQLCKKGRRHSYTLQI